MKPAHTRRQTGKPARKKSPGKKLQRRLAAYAVAAGAAAGGAQEADANIIHFDLEPDVLVQDTVLPLDLNKDFLVDFEIVHGRPLGPPWSGGFSVGLVQGVNGEVVGSSYVYPGTAGTFTWRYAHKLDSGDPIGPGADFQTHGGLGSFSTVNSSIWGEWPGEGEGFAGVQFAISGNTHYGWIRMIVDDFMRPTVMGYAFETEKDTPIPAGAVPEPCSLGMLALGAVGVTAMRKSRKKK